MTAVPKFQRPAEDGYGIESGAHGSNSLRLRSRKRYTGKASFSHPFPGRLMVGQRPLEP